MKNKSLSIIAILLLFANITNAQWSLTGNTGTNPTINFLGTQDNQPLVLITAGVEQIRVSTDGCLGIGTTAPAITDPIAIVKGHHSRISATIQNTHSEGNASFYGQNDRGSFGSYGGFLHGGSANPYSLFGNSLADKTVFLSDGANSEGLMVGTTAEKPVIVGTGNLERMRVLGNGNVGIGTATPSAKLEVEGGAKIDALTVTELKIETGANKSAGYSIGSSSTVTIITNKCHANSIIFLTAKNSYDAPTGVLYISSQGEGSFEVKNSVSGEHVDFNWFIINQP